MKNTEPGIGKTILEDLHRGDFRRSIRKDWKELKEFFIDEERKSRLEDMGKIKRWLYMFIWLLKSLFFKLTPPRRLLLITSVILMFLSRNGKVEGNEVQNGNDLFIFSGLIFIFIIMLELKDKLLARSELEAGRAVQNALMPDRSPNVPGWDIWLYTSPANDVGGDLVDFLQIDEGRFGITLADISGKGLGAALLMAKLQATLRALAPDFDSLSELGAKLNEIFHRDTMPKNFASMIYAVIQSDSRSINLINAGHMPPLILRNDFIEEIPKVAPALGLMKKAKYIEQNILLDSGEYLFIYSDGVTEARDEKGSFFGEERLRLLLKNSTGLSSSSTGEKLLQSLDAFIGDLPVYDDLSIAILRKK